MKSIKISTLLRTFIEQQHPNEHLLSPLMCNKKFALFFFRGHFVVLFVGFFVAVGLVCFFLTGKKKS